MATEHKDHLFEDWPLPSKYDRSIRREFALYLGGLVLLLMIITGLVISNKMVVTVTDNVVDRILAQARSYAGAASKQMIAADGPDVLMLTDICKKLMADNPDCGWVGIADKQGRFLAHTDMKQVISSSRLTLTRSDAYSNRLRNGEVLQMTDDSIIMAVPITEQGVTLGTLGIGSSTRSIEAVRKSALMTMAIITVVMILIGVPLTMLILSNRLRPFQLITEALRKVDVGNIRFDIPVKTHNEFGYLAETLRVMGERLDRARKQMVETERMTRELEIAREIQLNILPKKYPSGRGFEFSGRYQSAKTVGGDYYDFIDIDDDRLALVVADVSGKSLPGMLVMLLTRDLVISHARRLADPARLLSAVNGELMPEIRKGMFVTMFYGILDKRSGRFQFASAGHNPLIYYRAAEGACRLIKTKGYPLGMMNTDQFDKRIESGEIILESGDWLVQYTDGINEAMNAAKAEYGMDNLVTSVAEAASLSAAELAGDVINKVVAFVGEAPQNDDMTLLAMKWNGDMKAEPPNELREKVYVEGH
ncbi:putative Phosphoserine phosphatase [Candidatus Zixiibacteriota bacterium]|nr:putative Phosphoserine phosphatase [candidate division Zixibacteria bacterium]